MPPSPGGFSVGEIWESRGQYETWFNENVKPNVPAEIQQELTPRTPDLHRLSTGSKLVI